MGWSGGSRLMADIVKSAKHSFCGYGDFYEREDFYKNIIKSFEQEDCDTLADCLGIDKAFDNALFYIHPSWKRDE